MDAAPPYTIIEDEADCEWEASITRDPHDVDVWCDYAADKARRAHTKPSRAAVFERALVLLPGSYKLWHRYLGLRLKWISAQSPATGSPRVEAVSQAFERALVYMHKMPKIWLMYCDFLVDQRALTKARRAFDRALQALPPTQHSLVWDRYSRFATTCEDLPWETAERVLRRRVATDPAEGRAALIAFLRIRNRHAEAAKELVGLLQSDQSKQVRLELCALVSSHPNDTKHLVDLEQVVRAGLADANQDEEIERLWGALSDYCLRLSEFDRARDVFEQAMASAPSVRTFSAAFDAYSKFEVALLDNYVDGEEAQDAQFAFRVARLETLANRRALALSATLLRGTPNNIGEWLKRANLLSAARDGGAKQALCLETALDLIKPKDSYNGRPSSLWLALARLYQGEERAAVLRRATQTPSTLKDMIDAVHVWCARVEHEIEQGNLSQALALAREATTAPAAAASAEDPADASQPAADGAKAAAAPMPHRSLKLWNLLVDLEEVAGSFASARAAYDRMMQLKICTPLTVLNYAALLVEQGYHEDSFTVFERATSAFPWPHAVDLWLEYVQRFVHRFKGSKVERTRDLFEQALASCPVDMLERAEPLFYLYARFEEQHGLARRAMQVYERMCLSLPLARRLHAYLIWARAAQASFGAPSARRVFERAVRELPEKDAAKVCLRFADAERRLGEMERARAIYSHASQFCDPSVRDDAGFWEAWKEFEVSNGNEDTFRDMLRIKRSVAAHYSVLHQTPAPPPAVQGAVAAAGAGAVPNNKRPAEAAIEAAKPSKGPKVAPVPDAAEINLDDDDDEEEGGVEIQQQAVPAAVFGALERLTRAADGV